MPDYRQETTYLGTPCLTVRPPMAERPVTITHGTKRLVSSDRRSLVDAMYNTLNSQYSTCHLQRPELWDGQAAARIVATFLKELLTTLPLPGTINT